MHSADNVGFCDSNMKKRPLHRQPVLRKISNNLSYLCISFWVHLQMMLFIAQYYFASLFTGNTRQCGFRIASNITFL